MPLLYKIKSIYQKQVTPPTRYYYILKPAPPFHSKSLCITNVNMPEGSTFSFAYEAKQIATEIIHGTRSCTFNKSNVTRAS